MKKFNMNKIRKAYLSMMVSLSLMLTCTHASGKVATTFDDVVRPIVSLINDLMGPVLTLVGALGGLYCILLGVKFAKAEEPQEREKAKGNLKGAIIGFVLIFVLLLALNLSLPILQTWVETQSKASAAGGIKF